MIVTCEVCHKEMSPIKQPVTILYDELPTTPTDKVLLYWCVQCGQQLHLVVPAAQAEGYINRLIPKRS